MKENVLTEQQLFDWTTFRDDWTPICIETGAFLLSINDTQYGPVAIYFLPVLPGTSQQKMEATAWSHQSVNQTSGNVEIYTPLYLIELAKQVMGEIDLDPASSTIANRTVGAKCIFTKLAT